ncbi:transcriptional regulator, LysR family [Rubrobacter xylanophilus DSM 9941]|uniref:Transcriptional regulator, LysR family n=1 Tax=Rubrobacter xylanophilus (strain DSM 9941 / JCM 11954 / NBRC 16129 / PRD-1) TaxID=266117 RepID=Q1AVR3_RUBXD|nr:transcriptional regulator, LysR family [Rubrobacter xylanophilus DSM 9941]
MELRQLRYFVAVAEEQSFGGAARRLRISQPPLSLQIKALERELGVRLFDRNTRRVMLTDSGRAFLERARVILEEVERAKETAKGAERGLLGKLEVGFVSSATLSLLPPAIRLFRERFGGVELELRELTSAQQIDALYNGETRVGLVRLPLRAPGIHLEPVFEERLVVALPSGHPLEALDRVSLEAIADLPLIFFTRQLIPGLHAQIIELFQRVGAFPNVAQHAVHLQTIVGLVASGVGISILPSSAMRVRREGIVYLPLDEDDATSWLGLAWVEGDDSVLVENFVSIVREVAQSEAPREFSQAQD